MIKDKVALVQLADGMGNLPAFKGVGPALRGVWTWIRGLHMALYGEYIDDSNPSLVLPPVPGFGMFGSNSQERQHDLQEQYALNTMGIVHAGIVNDRWDGIDAWGERLRYRCVWYQGQGRGFKSWMCFWALNYPDVLKWSGSVTKRVRPWHGLYGRPSLPPDASVVTWPMVDALKIPLIVQP